MPVLLCNVWDEQVLFMSETPLFFIQWTLFSPHEGHKNLRV